MTVISTSTRNFQNRLGKGANVYLSSAELTAVAAMLGRLPTVEEYLEKASGVNKKAAEIYRYLNFHLMEKYGGGTNKVVPIAPVART